jgi:hypothetical protein
MSVLPAVVHPVLSRPSYNFIAASRTCYPHRHRTPSIPTYFAYLLSPPAYPSPSLSHVSELGVLIPPDTSNVIHFIPQRYLSIPPF